ncbi:cell division topological specificity factor MinE [Desulfoglaeba alkanexedens]|jgi:cell division topological specificity factor|uniref:Cell division topological specificity factor n=1 Tax=Desulfoglaeba alkanexedens ALDC TaxID=980445 RepID=A0A4P8L1K6_9BACT|nr:cell division topological specificity factor MinE [Desulfoglaeba alkanexedens]QCQ21757.1 cell division topological specificity factor MinE [Desulfoglaeba alkanexedens ALDC]
MLKAIQRFFTDRSSAKVARERMQVVLMHDRMDLTPDIMDSLKNDILAVLSRYMEIDQNSIRVDLEQGKGYTALVSNVQVKRVYRRRAAST